MCPQGANPPVAPQLRRKSKAWLLVSKVPHHLVPSSLPSTAATLILTHSSPATPASLLFLQLARHASRVSFHTGHSLCLECSSLDIHTVLSLPPFIWVLVQMSPSQRAFPDHSTPSFYPSHCFIFLPSMSHPIIYLFVCLPTRIGNSKRAKISFCSTAASPALRTVRGT